MKKFFAEFKAFALKGNVMNLAVGVIIGAAFQAVVSSLTDNILSPIIGLVAGANIDHLSATFLGVTLNYGAFLTSVINFIIMAFVVFVMVNTMNKLFQGAKKPAAEAKPPRKCPFCMTQVDEKASRCPSCTSEI